MKCDTCPRELDQLEPVSVALDLGNQVTLYLCTECEALIDRTLERERRKFFVYSEDPIVTVRCQKCAEELTPSKSGEYVIGELLLCAKCLKAKKVG